jgi:EmrB/QacA subfamily drug resistance transporter
MAVPPRPTLDPHVTHNPQPALHVDDPERQHPGVTLAVLALAGLAFALLQSLVAPALPEIQRDLHASESGVTWVLTAYLLSASVATPLLGRLGDIHGKERVLVWVLVALGAGTLLSALATSLPLLIAGRVVQGAGGGIFPLAFGIIRDEFPRERVAGSIGLISAILGIGGGAGIVLAGVIVDHLSYHWLFWFPLVAVMVATVATALFVPESPIKAPGRISWRAAALLSAGLAAVLLAVSQAPNWGWGSPRTLALTAAGLAVLAVWVRVELRSTEPLVDMRVMRLRGVWTTNLVGFLLGVGMFTSFIVIPQLVELPKASGFGFGASVTGAGLFLLPMTVMMLIVGPMAGRLERRFGSKPPLVAGTVFAACAFVLLALGHEARVDVYLASALLGVGIGLAFAAMANLIVEAVPADQTGVATGMNTIARSIGGALGSQVVASILSVSVVAATGLPREHSFTVSFWLAAGALAVGTLVALAIPGRSVAQEQEALAPRAAEARAA